MDRTMSVMCDAKENDLLLPLCDFFFAQVLEERRLKKRNLKR